MNLKSIGAALVVSMLAGCTTGGDCPSRGPKSAAECAKVCEGADPDCYLVCVDADYCTE